MLPNEQSRLQRILELLSIGIVEAVDDGVISIDEAERLLYSPKTMRCCEQIGAEPDLVNLIHVGTELESIKRLLPLDQWTASIDTIRTKARSVLSRTVPTDPELEAWFPKLIEAVDS